MPDTYQDSDQRNNERLEKHIKALNQAILRSTSLDDMINGYKDSMLAIPRWRAVKRYRLRRLANILLKKAEAQVESNDKLIDGANNL